MKTEGKLIEINQIDIITKLTHRDYSNLIYLFNTAEEIKILDIQVADFMALKKRTEQNIESLSPL